jgi:GAF domain-containing protein
MSAEDPNYDAGLAASAQGSESFEATLQLIVDFASTGIAGCWLAGITLLDRDGPTTAVATNEPARRVDRVQYEMSSGPCLDAYRNQTVYRIESTEDDEQWPEFSRAAADAGVLSTLSFPLIVNGDGIGALNLYSDKRSGFDDRDETAGAVFAQHASITLANARGYWQNAELRSHLEQALESRGVIDQAKGMLMLQQHCDADEAFEIIRRASQRSNRKVHDIAGEIVERLRNSDSIDAYSSVRAKFEPD